MMVPIAASAPQPHHGEAPVPFAPTAPDVEHRSAACGRYQSAFGARRLPVADVANRKTGENGKTAPFAEQDHVLRHGPFSSAGSPQ